LADASRSKGPQTERAIEAFHVVRRKLHSSAGSFAAALTHIRSAGEQGWQIGLLASCASRMAGVCEKPRIKCADCGNRLLIPLTDRIIYDFAGHHTVACIRCCPTIPVTFSPSTLMRQNGGKTRGRLCVMP
jgi:hypothetical protein